MSSPLMFKSGPLELPGLMLASVWMRLPSRSPVGHHFFLAPVVVGTGLDPWPAGVTSGTFRWGLVGSCGLLQPLPLPIAPQASNTMSKPRRQRIADYCSGPVISPPARDARASSNVKFVMPL